ncbi:MAG: hypothetical protein KAS32_10055 [Candidatus Peribacteraceae bacterium]|nr:hypothetical protein [Candidatus Peribacteraceae bacterium]
METLKNQTLYKCSYCGKRLLTKHGCKLHENEYCGAKTSPNIKQIINKRESCSHENIEEVWSYIPRESVKQPDHYKCVDSGAIL